MMPSKIQTGLISGCLLVGLAGWGRAAERPDPDAAARGKVIYQRYCASCHGSEARGNGPLAADLRVPPSDLTRLAEKNHGPFPFDVVARSIDGRQTTRGHGTPDMPVWGEIFPRTAGTESPSTSSAVGRIAHYLWSIQAARQ
jgi:mono/diheme cytochrome c family protein